VIQTGICVPVLLLAARRWTPNERIVAGLDAALDASAVLQPLAAIVQTFYDVVSTLDISALAAAALPRRNNVQQSPESPFQS
jgi:hypothetical protein